MSDTASASTWTPSEAIRQWLTTIENPELSFAGGPMQRVRVRNQPAISWLDGAGQTTFMLESSSGQEALYLRSHLSEPTSIQHPAAPIDGVRFRVACTDDLDLVKEIVLARLDGMTTSAIDPLAGPWGQFVSWARRFHERPEFDAEERDYKEQIVANIRAARDTLRAGEEWQPLLKRAFSQPNNLTPWQMHSNFLAWCDAEPEAARAALDVIWGETQSASERIAAFLRLVPKSTVSGPGLRLSLASFLQLAVDPYTLPPYRSTAIVRAYELTGYPAPPKNASEANVYAHALGLLDRVIEESRDRGLVLRDRLDAQSVLWCVAKWKTPQDWAESDQRAFETYRGDKVKTKVAAGVAA